ncbi:hypothetical protein C2G38_2173713 [Gigaspora rosea]|uniref:BTB domain-containing protein n=1 Tax=Gigaspora rosea TaxID=44941 RepID=A0A397VKN3_9GLOM|nr:hypothetical protein C2G38_2173713 [Gigaspora rosea]
MSLKILDQLSQDFTQLLENSYDYNVVIEVGKQPNIKLYKAHSAILYQRSLYFRQKLTNATKKNNVIEFKIPNLSVQTFDIIIRYIYSGIVSLENFEAATIFDLLIDLNEFQFIELVERIQAYLLIIMLLGFHPSMIFNSDDFKTLQENAFIALLKQDDLQMEESEIWDKVILWGKARTPDLPSNLEVWTDENFKSLKATLQHCLPHIRYFQIPSEDVLKKIKPYHNILEKNIWDDILAKYLAPNVPIASLILPPRKKATVQLPSRKASIITPSSSIITLEHIAELSSWIDRRSKIYNTTEIPYEFKLLLRGSRDGFTVLKIDSTNEILGGYNLLIWKVPNGKYSERATTADSFIFSLKNRNQSILSRVKDESTAIVYGKISQGPIFGNGLGMGRRSKSISKEWYSSETVYEKPIRNIDAWFFIDEYEVFQICKI